MLNHINFGSKYSKIMYLGSASGNSENLYHLNFYQWSICDGVFWVSQKNFVTIVDSPQLSDISEFQHHISAKDIKNIEYFCTL